MESVTPGHDGFRPLSSLLAIWPQKGLYRYQVWKAPDRPLCHLSNPPADLAGTHGAPMILCTPTFCPDQREAGPRCRESALCICSLSLLTGKSSERPAAVKGARVLRGEANPGRRGPFWNMGVKGKGACHIQVQDAVTRAGVRYVSFLHKTAHAIRTNLFASATIATFWWVRAIS